MFYSLLRRLLFQLEPETAHHITLDAIEKAFRLGLLKQPVIDCPQRRVMGITFPNPIGLAAGLDKNGEYLDALAALGFGFVEVGTVTPRPQPGNPAPRLFRIPQAQAIINRLGFNNQGIDRLLENINRSSYTGVLGINIGKNFDTPIEHAVEDYRICLSKAYQYASYITINISSPNTKNLRELQATDALDTLLFTLKSEQLSLNQTHGKYTPLVVKIAPDLERSQIASIAQLLLKHKIDGIIATNTTLSRQGIEHLAISQETGGLSGAPLAEKATAVVAQLRHFLQGTIPIIGVGGIMSAQDAKKKMDAGASLIQIYSGLIYQGPSLITRIAQTICKDQYPSEQA
ncbi:quinone-dependent dihydroorotate dehydrogenase [Nitrosomonas sp.]|uniref:quinone-dependent dihydroorotate dehydrogenase n=1 Tax=Nitrosomonas sp. TaxID=42353 RepID=UPI002845BE01|nr:quinone-dependent dihydroorotate dehydrogenase [Nitrosomonas sp.]MCP5242563.1 quinone-dependent dihydroorotate dehydrogenase [Burkholderiales bacterium]MDR4514079.1 quinone-dependent dihydroorotate dehydrogenase [Nitrosomonas sp.]